MLVAASLEKSFRPGKLSLHARPALVVLRGVDVHAHRGEVVGILGANGAGKTTLLHLIAGLAIPDRGFVLLDGERLDGIRARRVIGICSSADRSFYYRLSMRENLCFFGRLYGLARDRLGARVDSLLALLSLEAVAARRYSECSTGMRQRLALARALLADPPVLLLDEPTRGLDPLAAHHFRTLVRDTFAKRERKIVVMATNVLDEAWSVCDRVALLAQGRIAASGAAAAVRTRVTREFAPPEYEALR